MRIFLLVDKYFPSIQSCAKLMHDMACEMRDLGHEVILATADPDLSVPVRVTEEDGVQVLRVRSGRFRGVPLPVRAFNEWRLPGLFRRHAGAFFRDHPCDLIVSYAPPILLAPLVGHLKRLWGCPAYLVLRDIFPKWSVDAGVMREGSLVHRYFRRCERRAYDRADVIGVQSERNLDYFRDLDWGEYRLEVLHNWVATGGLDVGDSRLRRDLANDDRIVFLYGGNLGVAQDAMCLVDLAETLADEPRAKFVVVGDGSDAERLSSAARDRGLANLSFLPPVDHATYLGLVAECDVGLITLRRDLETHNFPGKMLDYLYFAKPILAAINPGNDLEDVLTEHEAGLVCENGDLPRLLAHARRLLDDRRLRETMGRRARKLLEARFSRARAARQILSHFAESVGEIPGEVSGDVCWRPGNGHHTTEQRRVEHDPGRQRRQDEPVSLAVGQS